MAGKEGHFDVLKLIVTKHFMCSNINLNTQDVDGLTPFDLVVWLLDTLEYLQMIVQTP